MEEQLHKIEGTRNWMKITFYRGLNLRERDSEGGWKEGGIERKVTTLSVAEVV